MNKRRRYLAKRRRRADAAALRRRRLLERMTWVVVSADPAGVVTIEDARDLAAARRALNEPGRTPWAAVKAELGLTKKEND